MAGKTEEGAPIFKTKEEFGAFINEQVEGVLSKEDGPLHKALDSWFERNLPEGKGGEGGGNGEGTPGGEGGGGEGAGGGGGDRPPTFWESLFGR